MSEMRVSKRIVYLIAASIVVAAGAVALTLYLVRSPTLQVAVALPDLSLYECELGRLNTSMVPLGAVALIDPSTKHVAALRLLEPTEDELDTSAQVKRSVEQYQGDFAFTYDIELSEQVKANIESRVRQSTELVVSRYRRITIKDPLAKLNNDSDLLARIEEDYADPSYRFMFVYAVIPAEQVTITVSDKANTGVETAVLRVGRYRVSVEYSGTAALDRLTEDSPAFFKAQFLTLAFDQGGDPKLVLDPAFMPDLSTYEMPHLE